MFGYHNEQLSMIVCFDVVGLGSLSSMSLDIICFDVDGEPETRKIWRISQKKYVVELDVKIN
jgi:hypothetical protein